MGRTAFPQSTVEHLKHPGDPECLHESDNGITLDEI